MSVYVIRAFASVARAGRRHRVVLKRLAQIDKTLLEQDGALRAVWTRLQPLLTPAAEPPKPRIGFTP
jgi:hypothetical protein